MKVEFDVSMILVLINPPANLRPVACLALEIASLSCYTGQKALVCMRTVFPHTMSVNQPG